MRAEVATVAGSLNQVTWMPTDGGSELVANTGRHASAQEPQCASTVLMIRPQTFYANPETQATNPFQHPVAVPAAATLAAAQAEFDAAADALVAAGIDVVVASADANADTPDALYPNNWFSTHPDGRIVLYPMATPNRRRERRPDLLATLADRRQWRIGTTLDLSPLEEQGLVLEGTGSLVLDREHRLAYAARSPRTHEAAVRAFATAMGYKPILFDTRDAEGRPIYHTNVIMSVGPSIALLASEVVTPGPGLRDLFDALEHGGQQLLDLSADQIRAFAGNALFLDAGSQGPVVAISRRALASLSRAQRMQLEQHARPVPCAVETIEHIGGGGIRCMLAEIFLPPR